MFGILKKIPPIAFKIVSIGLSLAAIAVGSINEKNDLKCMKEEILKELSK